MTNRQEADFWVTFGSNAREFSAALPGQLKAARDEIALLKKDLATLFDEAAGQNPSLGQGLIKELQGANREIQGLTTGIQRMASELNIVVEKLHNLKVGPSGGGVAGGSVAGSVSPAAVQAAAAGAAKKAVAEYVATQEAQAKAATETATAGKRGASSSQKAAKDISASVAAGEAADKERIAAEQQIAKQKQRDAANAKRVAQAQAAAAAPATTATAPVVVPRAPQRPPTPVAPPANRTLEAQRLVAGLSGQQILDKLSTQGVDHPSALAQALGLSGRGGPKEVANRIAKQYQNFVAEAGQAAEKAVGQAVAQAQQQIAAMAAGPYRQGPGGVYKARTAAEWESYSGQAGFSKTVENMGGIGALQGVGYQPITLEPGSATLRKTLYSSLEKLQATHPEVSTADVEKTQTSRKRTAAAVKRIAVAEESSAKATEELAAQTEQQAAVLEAEVAETRAAGTMSLVDVRQQIQERVQRQREVELLDRNQKSRQQIDKIKDPIERETAIRQWETRQRQTASFESQGLAATVIPYEGLSARGSLDLVRTRLLTDQTAGLSEDDAIATARRINYATSEQRMQGLMATGRSKKRTPVGTMIDTEYAGYVQSAQEAAAAHTPVTEFQQIRQQLARTEEAKEAYQQAIARVLEADTQELRDTTSLLRKNARAGGQSVQVTRGAEPIRRANIEEVLARGGVYGAGDERSLGLLHEQALIENRANDIYGRIGGLREQQQNVRGQLRTTGRAVRENPEDVALRESAARLNQMRDAIAQQITASYEELNTLWDQIAPYSPSVGRGGAPHTQAEWQRFMGAADRTKTAGAHTIPGPTGSIIPTPENVRDNRPTVGGVTEEERQRLIGTRNPEAGYYGGMSFQELRSYARDRGVTGRGRQDILGQLLQQFPPGKVAEPGAFQRIGELTAGYEQTASREALSFLQENPNWDPFAKVGTPRGKRGQGPSTRRAVQAVNQAIEYWDKLALDFDNYIKSISAQIEEAGGMAKAPTALVQRLGAVNETAIATLGPNARALMSGAASREQYRAARESADAQPGSRVQRQTSADQMFFSAHEQLFGPRLGLIAPYMDQGKTAFGPSDWRLRGGQVTGGFENYVAPLMRGDLTGKQMRGLRQATDVAAGTGDALHNFITTSLPSDFSGDVETLPQALKVELQRLRKAASQARQRLDKLITQYSAINEGEYVADIEPSAAVKKQRIKDQTTAGQERQQALGLVSTSALRDMEARQADLARIQGAVAQYEEYFASGSERPTVSARQHIGQFLGVAPTGFTPEARARGADVTLIATQQKIKDALETGKYAGNEGDAKAKLADIERQLNAPAYEEDAFTQEQIAEARRRVDKLHAGVTQQIVKAKDNAAAAATAVEEVPPSAREAEQAARTVATPTGTHADAVREVSGTAPLNDVASVAVDRLIAAIDRLGVAIEKLYNRFRPGQRNPEGMEPATATGSGAGGGGGRRRPAAAAADMPEDPAARQLAAQQSERASERLSREQREQAAYAEAQRVASARQREIIGTLPVPTGPEDNRANVRNLVSQALVAGSSNEKLDLLTQAGVSMRRQYGYRYKSEIPQLAEVAGLSREDKGVLDVRVSAAAKAYTQAAEAAKRLRDVENDEAAAAERVAATQGLVDKAMQTVSQRTAAQIAEVQRLIAVERQRALTDAESAQLFEARVQAYGSMESEYTRINPDTRRPVLNQALRRPLERAALGVSGPQLLDIHQEAGARDAIKRVADAGVDESIAQGGRLRRAMSAMFGVNNSFAGRAIAGAGTAVVRTFSYGLVFGVVNEMQKIFRASVETEAEFVRISDALNATGRSAGNLRSSLQSISSDLATPLEEVYVTASQLTGIFTTTRDVEFATRAVEQLKLISRGALNSQEAISSLQAVTSAYGLTGAAAFQQVVDKATAIQNFTGANVEQLLEGAGGIAPQAAAFHLTENQALLYPGLIAQRTNQSGTAASEQLSRIFESLAAPAASQFLTRRGFATEDQVRGSQFGAIIQQLVHARATGQLNDQDLVSMERLVGARQARPLAALIGTQTQAQQTERGAAAAVDAAGAGQERVHQLMQQLNRQLQQLSVNLTNIGAALVRSGLLGGLQHAVGLLNIILQVGGKIGDVFSALGHIPGFNFLKTALVDAGSLYVAAKLIGATVRSVGSYTSRTLAQNDEAAMERRAAAGYAPTVGTPASGAALSARGAVIAEQNAMRQQVQNTLANQQRYSFFRNPVGGLVAGAGTLGSRLLDTPFLRLGTSLQKLETPSERINSLTTRMGSGMTSLGRSMTTASASSQVLRGRIEELAASGTVMGHVTGLLMGLGNAALFAAPFIIGGVQALQESHRTYQDYLASVFPDAIPNTDSSVNQNRNTVQQTASQQAIAQSRNQSHGFFHRVGAFGSFVTHEIGGAFQGSLTGGQAQIDDFAGSFSNRATTIGDPSRAAEPLNNAISDAADSVTAAITGLSKNGETIDQANAQFTEAAKKIANDSKLSDAQKTVATAWLETWHRKTTDIFLAMQQKAAGIADVNQLTADQAGSFTDVLQGGLGLTTAQRRNGIGPALYQTMTDQGLVAQNSDAAYYFAQLYGTSAAVPDEATYVPHNFVGPLSPSGPGGPEQRLPSNVTLNPDGSFTTHLPGGKTLPYYQPPPSESQAREHSLLQGINPNTDAGQLALQGKLADTLEKNAIPALSEALHAEQGSNVQQYAADLAKFKTLVDFDGQIRLQMAQEAVQSATELSQILLGQGDNGGAIKALDQAIAADKRNLGNAKTASERYAIQLDIAQKQRQQADIAAQPGIGAAQLAAASATNPGAQAQANLDAANKQLAELQGLRANKKGGVTDADISAAKVSVANAQQAITANSEQITESAAALLQAQAFDPFTKVQENINELNREIGYYRSRGDTAKVNELSAQLVAAQQSAADLAAEAAQANTNLLIAIATAAGHVVQAARLGLTEALQAYHQALKDNGGDKNAPAVKNAYAAVVAARANIRDTFVQNREDDLKFQYDMQKISLQQYEQQLQDLLKRKDLTKRQRQDIERTLKELGDQNQGQWNFGDVTLPTPYEVRRLMKAQQAGVNYDISKTRYVGAGTAAAVATNSVTHNQTNNVTINTAVRLEQIEEALKRLLGPQATQRRTTTTRRN